MKNRIKYLLLALLISSETFTNGDVKEPTMNAVLKKSFTEQVEKLYRESIKEQQILTFLEKKQMLKYFGKPERDKAKQIAQNLSIDVEWLYMVIYKESRGNPKAINKITNATGLIQWMPSTAVRFDTTVESLYEMSVLEQLDYVEKYIKFFQKKSNIDSYLDLYLCIFYPSAIGKELSHVISNGGNVYKANKGIDHKGNNDGILSLYDIKQWLS